MHNQNRGDDDMTTQALTAERVDNVTELRRGRGGAGTLMGHDGERLVEWLRDVFQLHTDDRPVVVFLRHVTPHRRIGDKLGTIQLKLLSAGQRTAENAPEMAHMIWAKAENYAFGLGGNAQQFAAHAHYEDNPADSETGCYFWIKLAGEQSDRSVDSLTPDERGVTKLLMAKLDKFEDNFCDIMTGAVTMMDCMRVQMRDLNEQSLAERKERRENEEMIRKAKLETVEQAEKREEAKAHRETQRELVASVKTVALAAARKWGGLDVRDVTTPGNQQLMLAFESLARDEGRFMSVLAALNETERVNFMEWWQAQLASLEQMRGGKNGTAQPVAPAAPAAPAAAPAASAASAQPSAADQAAQARVQAQQWAAVAAALEADAAAAAAANKSPENPPPAPAAAAAEPVATPPAADTPTPASAPEANPSPPPVKKTKAKTKKTPPEVKHG